jgi:RNA polymerase sigma factor (sigma-70 family)
MDTPTAIQRLQTGDRGEPWAFLYAEFLSDVRLWARSVLNNPDAADDVAQQVMISLPDRIGHYDSTKGPFLPWLLGATTRRALRWNTAENCRQKYLGVRGIYVTHPCSPYREESVLDDKARERLRDALAALPSAEDRTLIQEFLDGYRPDELAGKYGCSPAVVRNRTRGIIKHIKQEVLQ